ncbi:hypothetical protein BACOVA_02768 [Bacteroides ovatus ATCC 8483]|uniref:Uncharacterized protein n=1 Tax=Bacteroides ovatus (strain ATCC 8483 / DSM 1896 / JCM 5824 / BCRC 10623 / CCUG 4943 / NCTC 11153) TaxID=411476 RepID=A0AAN3A825_BACO1|nr:hypothetical protein BACOVA_02768 [Bacteroides ovatus ATCC 8483]
MYSFALNHLKPSYKNKYEKHYINFSISVFGYFGMEPETL